MLMRLSVWKSAFAQSHVNQSFYVFPPLPRPAPPLPAMTRRRRAAQKRGQEELAHVPGAVAARRA